MFVLIANVKPPSLFWERKSYAIYANIEQWVIVMAYFWSCVCSGLFCNWISTEKNRKFRHTKHYFNYTFFLRTSKIIMRLNALIFWRFSSQNVLILFFLLFFYETLLTVNGENYYKVYTLFMRTSKFCLRRAVP